MHSALFFRLFSQYLKKVCGGEAIAEVNMSRSPTKQGMLDPFSFFSEKNIYIMFNNTVVCHAKRNTHAAPFALYLRI